MSHGWASNDADHQYRQLLLGSDGGRAGRPLVQRQRRPTSPTRLAARRGRCGACRGSPSTTCGDLDTVDFRGGVPLTCGVDRLAIQACLLSLSSRTIGDEFAINNPGSLDDRINYVRDAMVLGASYYAVPSLRLYAEGRLFVQRD